MSIRKKDIIMGRVELINAKLGEELSAKEALERDVAQKWSAYTAMAADKEKPHTEEEVKAALNSVREAISFVNDLILSERLDALKDIPYVEAFKDYMKTQYVVGYSVGKEKGAEGLSLSAKTQVMLDGYDFLSSLCSADLNGIIDMCCVFVDNVARAASNDCDRISMKSLSPLYLDLKKRLGWDLPKNKLSRNELARELSKIASAISAGVCTEMYRTDVFYVSRGIVQSKIVCGEGGKIHKRDERTIIRYIIQAIFTRYNDLEYGTLDNSRSERAPLTVERNKEMGEPAAKAQVTPDAGAVTVTTEEPKKSATKTGKKSGKKTEKKSEKKAAQTEEDKLVADIMAAAQA